jgi:CBS domain containing-hemolysin-like protein
MILLLLFLAAASIALATVEAAFYLLRRRRLSHVALQNPRAEMVNRYLEDPPTLLMPVHIGAFTAHAGMTVIITGLFLDWLSHWAILVAFCVMLIYLLLFRLTLPYTLVRRNPERSLLVLIPFFHLYAQALGPLVAALRKRAALQAEEPGEAAATAAVPEVPPAPVHERDEDRLVDSLHRFTATPVRDVMTPRPDIVAIQAAAPVRDLWRLMRETKYSRIPIFGENLDDIVGVVEIRDLIDYDGDIEEPVRPLAKSVYLVPETKRISELLKDMQAQRTTFAVIIDEYGGTAGIASMEDIVEELVGEIKDEYDVEAEPIAVEGDGAVVVAGRVNLDRLEQALETALSDSDDVGTVGGLVTTVFGRIPRAGEKMEHRGFCLEVLDAERKRVNRVRFRRIPASPAQEP